MSANTHSTPLSPDTIGEIYSAAVSTDAWPDALDRCCAHVGAASAALMSVDMQDPTAYSINALGGVLKKMDTTQLQYYIENFGPLDTQGHEYSLQVPSRQVFLDTDIWPGVDLANRRDSLWLKKHFGVRRRIALRLNDNLRYFENLAFQFADHMDEVPALAFTNIQPLAPHIGKSLEMSILYGRLQQHYAAVLSVLDKVGVGMCIVEASGAIIVANTETQRILDSDHELTKSTAGRLNCKNNDDTAQLDAMIYSASMGHHAPVAESILTLRPKPTDHPLIIEVSPLRDHYDELNSGRDAVLVQLFDADCSQHCNTKLFAAAYQLSPAESEIVPLILDGLTNPEIADKRHTSIDTVKTQISSLMQKASVKSRVQLVRRILKTEPPVTAPTKGPLESKPR